MLVLQMTVKQLDPALGSDIVQEPARTSDIGRFRHVERSVFVEMETSQVGTHPFLLATLGPTHRLEIRPGSMSQLRQPPGFDASIQKILECWSLHHPSRGQGCHLSYRSFHLKLN
jgi:hypothetical protein